MWHLIGPQPTFQIHVPAHQPKQNMHSFTFCQPHAFVHNCFLFPQKLSFSPNKIGGGGDVLMFKNTVQRSRFCSNTGSLPAVPQSSPLCDRHSLLVPCNTTFCPTWYLCSLSPQFFRSLRTSPMSFVQWLETPVGGGSRRRGNEERSPVRGHVQSPPSRFSSAFRMFLLKTGPSNF